MIENHFNDNQKDFVSSLPDEIGVCVSNHLDGILLKVNRRIDES